MTPEQMMLAAVRANVLVATKTAVLAGVDEGLEAGSLGEAVGRSTAARVLEFRAEALLDLPDGVAGGSDPESLVAAAVSGIPMSKDADPAKETLRQEALAVAGGRVLVAMVPETALMVMLAAPASVAMAVAVRQMGEGFDDRAFAQGFVEGAFPAFGQDGRTTLAEALPAAMGTGPAGAEMEARVAVMNACRGAAEQYRALESSRQSSSEAVPVP